MKPLDIKPNLPCPERREFTVQLLVAGLSALAGGALQISCGKLGEREMTLKPLRVVLKDALKERIATDDPGNFNDSIWNATRFGVYYDDDVELVNIVIYETTVSVAQKQKTAKYLPDEVWRNLIAKVGCNNTPDEALDPMVDAVLMSMPLPAGNEGPIINGPRKRPTLRSQRIKNGTQVKPA